MGLICIKVFRLLYFIMRILVLGSRGVIGSEFCKHALGQGHDITEWDIQLCKEHDLRIPNNLFFVLKEVDAVAFFAFDVGGSKYSTETADYISNNMKLLENTFDSVRTSGLPFIHTTSQMSNMDHNPYGPLKRLAEFYTEYLGGVNIKVWNVYGHEEISEKSHVMSDFIHQAKTTGEIRMLTTGEETRQFLHGNDFARASLYILENIDSFKGKMIDLSSFEWITIRSVADVIAARYNAKVIPGTVTASYQTKVNEPRQDFLETGWKPEISIEDYISEVFSVDSGGVRVSREPGKIFIPSGRVKF